MRFQCPCAFDLFRINAATGESLFSRGKVETLIHMSSHSAVLILLSSETRGIFEEFEVAADELVGKVKQFLHEGNIRRIVVKKDNNIIMEVPLTIAAIGIIGAPVLAAVGAIAAFVGNYKVVVERRE
jgi:hypothetical protein